MDRVPSASKQDLRKQLDLPNEFNVVMAARMDSDKDQRSFILGAYEALLIDNDIIFLFYNAATECRFAEFIFFKTIY